MELLRMEQEQLIALYGNPVAKEGPGGEDPLENAHT